MLLIDFINVGYGDAILIREKNPGLVFTMMVDCGNTTTGTVEDASSQRIDASEFLRNEGVTHLDLLVLTHLHRDHIGGIGKLLESVTVAKMWTGYLPEPTLYHEHAKIEETYSKRARGVATTLNMLAEAFEKLSRTDCTLVQVNMSCMDYSLTPVLLADIFCADQHLYVQQNKVLDDALSGVPNWKEMDLVGQEINQTGIRIRLSYHGRSIVLPADVHAKYWESDNNQPCYILKAPHHAIEDSMTEKLISTLQPEYTVVTVSNNREDNRPSLDMIALLQQYSKHVLFTDAVSAPGITPLYHQTVRINIE